MHQYSFFVSIKKVIYRYDANQKELVFIKDGIYMEKGMQNFIKEASVNIVGFFDYK